MTQPRITFTVDVEDWYQVEGLSGRIARESWPDRESRVERNTERILELLRRHRASATFFVLGSVAERTPQLVRRIAAEGHEIASHGCDHQQVFRLAPAAFREDIRRSKGLLEDLAGRAVEGYRAPKFSITDWAIDLLREEGYRYDSSLCAAGAHDRYARLSRPPLPLTSTIRRFENGLVEVALSLVRIARWHVPWSGGGFFRLLPYGVYRGVTAHLARQPGGFTFYIHPWELDRHQPRVEGVRLASRLKHYGFRSATAGKLAALLGDFAVCSIRDTLARSAAGPRDPAPAGK